MAQAIASVRLDPLGISRAVIVLACAVALILADRAFPF
jgi:hypothetical protein